MTPRRVRLHGGPYDGSVITVDAHALEVGHVWQRRCPRHGDGEPCSCPTAWLLCYSCLDHHALHYTLAEDAADA